MSKECIACGQTEGRFEKHHYPIPKIHGGKETITLCLMCHNLVSRIPLSRWPWEIYKEIISSDLRGPVLLAFLQILEKLYKKTIDNKET